jgi:metal-responsive CopG/Arc/MetJ family transcriptional regulator
MSNKNWHKSNLVAVRFTDEEIQKLDRIAASRNKYSLQKPNRSEVIRDLLKQHDEKSI